MQPTHILMCEEHDIPLVHGGFCVKCNYYPDMQSTYIVTIDLSPTQQETTHG